MKAAPLAAGLVTILAVYGLAFGITTVAAVVAHKQRAEHDAWVAEMDEHRCLPAGDGHTWDCPVIDGGVPSYVTVEEPR